MFVEGVNSNVFIQKGICLVFSYTKSHEKADISEYYITII